MAYPKAILLDLDDTILDSGDADAAWRTVSALEAPPHVPAFRHALTSLEAEPEEAWMVGDNLDKDIRGAQEVGIYAIRVDKHRTGLPPDTGVTPDRAIPSLSALFD